MPNVPPKDRISHVVAQMTKVTTRKELISYLLAHGGLQWFDLAIFKALYGVIPNPKLAFIFPISGTGIVAFY